MSDLAQRVEAALAAGSAVLLSAHAHLSRGAAVRLSARLPGARTISLYCHAHDLSPVDASWLRIEALAQMGPVFLAPVSAVPGGASRMARIRFAIHEWLRVHFAPRGDAALHELLEYEYAGSRAVILKIHVRNALRLAAAARPEFSGPAAVALYLDRLRVPADIRGAVYALALEQLAVLRSAAMLAAGDGRAPGNEDRHTLDRERVPLSPRVARHPGKAGARKHDGETCTNTAAELEHDTEAELAWDESLEPAVMAVDVSEPGMTV